MLFLTPGAFPARRASDAFHAFLFCFYDISNRASQHGRQYSQRYEIHHMNSSFFLCRRMQAVGFRELPVGLADSPQHDQNKDDDCDKSRNKSGSQRSGCDQCADLIYQEGNGVAGSQLKADASKQPFSALHLRVHGSERREARRRIKIEHQVRKSSHFGKSQNCCHCISTSHQRQFISIDQIGDAVYYRQRADYIFFCDKSGHCRCRQLPYAKSKRDKENGDRVGNACQNGSILCAFRHQLNCQLKVCMIWTTVLHTRIIVPALIMYALPAFQHGNTCPLQAWDLIFRKFNDEERFRYF